MTELPLNATLAERVDLNERYVRLRVRPDEQPIPSFTPGQFVQLGLPQPAKAGPGEGAPRMRIAKRSYSIASSAEDRETYEFLVTLVSGGRLTPELWKIDAGSRCWIGERALGSFTLDGVPRGTDLVMVATGSGISPYVSMVRTHGGDPPWKRLVLVHGVRLAEDLAYRSELEQRQRDDPCFRYVPVVSREPERWTGLKGRVQAALEDERFCGFGCGPLDPLNFHVFLCGNPDMIQSVRGLLESRGFTAGTADSPGNLHFEKYW